MGKIRKGQIFNDGTNFIGYLPLIKHIPIWTVPEDASGPKDLSSKLWMYHSHVSETNDTNSGLIGPIVITRKNMQSHDLL